MFITKSGSTFFACVLVVVALAIEEIAADDCSSDFTCLPDERCVTDETTGKPKCVCNNRCFLNYEPVCGSDNKTYGNMCRLEGASCRDRSKGITKAYDGPCEDRVPV